jgi:hypothetical protein
MKVGKSEITFVSTIIILTILILTVTRRPSSRGERLTSSSREMDLGLTTATRDQWWNSLTGAQKRSPTLEAFLWEGDKVVL